MSPNAAIIQGLLVGLMLAAIAAFGWVWQAVGLLGGALILLLLPYCLGRPAAKAPATGGGPKGMERSERRKVRAGLLLVALPPLAILLIPSAPGFIDVTQSGKQGVILAMLLITTVVLYLVFASTLTDWFYVLPHLRGGCGTICATSLEGQWRGVTRVWLLHRALATLGGIAGATALVAIAANSWVRPIDETVAGAIAAVATIIAGYYLTRAAPLLAIAINPPVQVGDVIEIAEEFNVHKPGALREYFVVDVALEGVKLLQVGEEDVIPRSGPDARRTHDRTVDVMEISKLLRGRRPVKPCARGCQRLTKYCACKSAWLPSRDPSTLGAAETA
ncbi:MAG: hypothetical protein ACTHN3_05030 [Solirubrobacterales bacterium]